MSKDIKFFLESNHNINKFIISRGEADTIIINVHLQKFTTHTANDLFSEFMRFIGYKYLNIYITKEFPSQIEYSYLTATEKLNGVKMVITIS